MNPINDDIIVSGGGDDKGFLWRCDTGEQLSKLLGNVIFFRRKKMEKISYKISLASKLV